MLSPRNLVLVFSEHSIYELAKTYMSAKPNSLERGRELLSYFQRYLGHALCIKKPIELVAAEMWALKLREPNIDVFHDEINFGIVRGATARLASGVIDEAANYTGQMSPEYFKECHHGSDQPTYPLLEALLRIKGLTLQPTYTNADVASLFGVSVRTIQSRAADGSLP